MRFILTLALGIMIGPAFWSVARRYDPQASPSYVLRSAATWSIAEIQHLSASAAKYKSDAPPAAAAREGNQ